MIVDLRKPEKRAYGMAKVWIWGDLKISILLVCWDAFSLYLMVVLGDCRAAFSRKTILLCTSSTVLFFFTTILGTVKIIINYRAIWDLRSTEGGLPFEERSLPRTTYDSPRNLVFALPAVQWTQVLGDWINWSWWYIKIRKVKVVMAASTKLARHQAGC